MSISFHLAFFNHAWVGLHIGITGLYLLRITHGCGEVACHISLHVLGLECGGIYHHPKFLDSLMEK